jgi:hypothetical protein
LIDADSPTLAFLDRGLARKERGRVAVIAHAHQHQGEERMRGIETAATGKGAEIVLV